ncbi:MAG: hypothetical protein HZY78_06860 [Burkholderiaceae bacterium]|nr:MAG: hypothetical protein HZY78_06860 [Burkholderiaceae bacterium]
MGPQGPGDPGGATNYQNLIVVAKSGGQFTSIQAALNSISDAAAANRYLVYVAPGEYAERVTMKPFVDIEGAGELVTRIVNSSPSSTVMGANDSELRFLTVENRGASSQAIGIQNIATSPRLTHVSVLISGGASSNTGISNINASATVMKSVTVRIDPAVAAVSTGIEISSGASAVMNDVAVNITGGGNASGMTCNSYSTLTVQNVNVNVSGAGGAGYGIYSQACSLTASQSSIRVSAGGNILGVYSIAPSAPPTLNGMNIAVSGGPTATPWGTPIRATRCCWPTACSALRGARPRTRCAISWPRPRSTPAAWRPPARPRTRPFTTWATSPSNTTSW